MDFDYFDMLSGYPIFMPHVGHIRSPKLKEICPTVGLGHWMYTFYISTLSWDKDDLLDYLKIIHFRGEAKLHRKELNIFDIISLVPQLRELYREVLGFFIVEELAWDEKERVFKTLVVAEDERMPVGVISRENFGEVCRAILKMNFIGLDSNISEPKFASEKAKELWERAQKYLKEQKHTDKAQYHLNNIISKLCVAHPSYNFLNIFDLTVFQLYDAFFEYGYIRSANLGESIFSNHGGDHFDFEGWLKPIL